MVIDPNELDHQAQGKHISIRASKHNDINTHSIMVPIIIQNERVSALLDTGADTSLLDRDFVQRNKWHITPLHNAGPVILSIKGQTGQRYGQVHNMQLTYRGRTYIHTFEVLPLSENTTMTIGLDLMSKLGISIHGLATKWDDDTRTPTVSNETYKDVPTPNESPAGTDDEHKEFLNAIQPYLQENAAISKDTFCNVPQSVVKLETPPGVTSYRPQYTLPEAAMGEVKKQIQEWLADGVIEIAPTSSAWNSPLTLAPKKDAAGNYVKLRLCLDPRHINQLLPDNHFPIPLIKQIFHALRGAQIFTTLDLKSAFHRFAINPDDRHKLQFSILGQQYRWVGAPFGLKMLPSIFQATMGTLFNNLPFVRCFIDDIVIYSANMIEHRQHVQQVIQILTDANLILNQEKCHFAQQSVYLLGFCISYKGQALDARKVTNVLSWPRPTTGKEIMKFLGVITYFREWIPNVSTLTAPLDKLRYVDSLHNSWGPQQENAF